MPCSVALHGKEQSEAFCYSLSAILFYDLFLCRHSVLVSFLRHCSCMWFAKRSKAEEELLAMV